MQEAEVRGQEAGTEGRRRGLQISGNLCRQGCGDYKSPRTVARELVGSEGAVHQSRIACPHSLSSLPAAEHAGGITLGLSKME